MCNKDGKTTVLPKTVRAISAIIDELYQLTSTSPFYGGFKGTTGRYRQVISILVKRGCILREGHHNKPIFSWNPNAMPPTKYFYESVAEEVVLGERSSKARFYAKQKAEKKMAETIPATKDETVYVDNTYGTMAVDLSSVSERDMLDELYRRGWKIGNGEMVRTESMK